MSDFNLFDEIKKYVQSEQHKVNSAKIHSTVKGWQDWFNSLPDERKTELKRLLELGQEPPKK